MSTERNVPKLRFPGFTEPWEQRKLENFGKATGGTSIESEFSEDGIYKVISIGSYSENSIYNDQGIRAIKSDKTCNRVLNKNDLTMILNDKTTSGNIIGRVLLIEKSGIYVYNQRTERIEINVDEYYPVFLYEMLNAPNVREKIVKQAQGNTQIYVNWSTIAMLDYMIPSREEQVRIGQYLHSISNLINLHQRKLEHVKDLKKSMLQKMFPKNGQEYPELRFPGFTEPWEQCKLGNVIEELKSGLSRQLDNADIGLPVVRANNISDGKLDMNNDVKYWYKDDPQGADTRNYLIHKNDILINFINSESKMGTATIVDTEPDRDTIYTTNILKMKVDNTVSDSLFLLYLTMTYHYCNYIKSITKPAVNQASFTTVDYKNYSFMMPLLEEQKKIGIYLNKIDHLITLHQRELEHLKLLKKGMLQQMLV